VFQHTHQEMLFAFPVFTKNNLLNYWWDPLGTDGAIRKTDARPESRNSELNSSCWFRLTHRYYSLEDYVMFAVF
jgi:hypothetical protein